MMYSIISYNICYSLSLLYITDLNSEKSSRFFNYFTSPCFLTKELFGVFNIIFLLWSRLCLLGHKCSNMGWWVVLVSRLCLLGNFFCFGFWCGRKRHRQCQPIIWGNLNVYANRCTNVTLKGAHGDIDVNPMITNCYNPGPLETICDDLRIIPYLVSTPTRITHDIVSIGGDNMSHMR